MNVIVTDVRYRMSLPIIRSLGRVGARITAADRITTPDKAALGFYSKYTHARAHLPSPENTDDFLSALCSLDVGERAALIPVGIDTLLTLCANRKKVSESFDIALPPMESIELANDKLSLMRYAKDQGVPCPATATLRDGEEISELAARVAYPAVIKYRAGELLQLDPKDRYCIVKGPEELIARYEKMHELQEKPIVQEYVSGEGFGVSVVMDKQSNPLKLFCHRRIHEYPTSGGPSCLCESAWNNELAEHAVKLLKSLNWHGVAMVEFKGTPSGGYKLMEINPRIWGSVALAPAAGCDIASAIVASARGELSAVSELSPDYRVGKRMRFLLQDILAFPSYLKSSKNKFAFALKYMALLLDPRCADGVFKIYDPMPGIRYLIQAFKKKDKIIR